MSHHRSKLLLSAALFLAAMPARAQQAAKPVTLDAVTATATKTSHALDDIAGNVTVIDLNAIEEHGAQKLDDLLRDLPGVEMQGGPRAISQDISIRGMGGQRVVTTIDGARQNFDAGHKGRLFLDPDLLRQVDVVRGGNSALHGSGSVGGVVSLETKNASDLLNPGESFGFRTKYGFNTANDSPLYSMGLFGRMEDRLDIFANVAYRFDKDVMLGDGRRLENSEMDIRDVLIKSTLRPTENQSFTFSMIDVNQSGRVPLNPDGTQNTTDNLPADRITRERIYSAAYSYTNPDNALLNPTVKLHRSAIDVDERRRGGNPPDRNDESFFTTTGIDAFNTSRISLWGQQHAITFGSEFYRDEQEGLRNKGPRPQFPSAQADVGGLYIQDEIILLETVTVTPALRYDRYNQGGTTNSTKMEEDAVSPRLGVNWKALDWTTIYASYGYGFRAPGLTELYGAGAHLGPQNLFVPNPNLRPEKTKTAEIGTRLHFGDMLMPSDRLGLNAAYFHTKATDFIETVVSITNPATLAGSTTTRNIPNAQIDGVEFSADYETKSSFSRLGMSRIRGENTDLNTPVDSIPADKINLTMGYKMLQYGLRLGWRGEFVANQENVSNVPFVPGTNTATQTTSGYVLHSLFLSWLPPVTGLAGFRVDAGIDNLFDRSYRRHLASLYEEGRDYRIAVSYTKGF